MSEPLKHGPTSEYPFDVMRHAKYLNERAELRRQSKQRVASALRHIRKIAEELMQQLVTADNPADKQHYFDELQAILTQQLPELPEKARAPLESEISEVLVENARPLGQPSESSPSHTDSDASSFGTIRCITNIYAIARMNIPS